MAYGQALGLFQIAQQINYFIVKPGYGKKVRVRVRTPIKKYPQKKLVGLRKIIKCTLRHRNIPIKYSKVQVYTMLHEKNNYLVIFLLQACKSPLETELKKYDVS